MAKASPVFFLCRLEVEEVMSISRIRALRLMENLELSRKNVVAWLRYGWRLLEEDRNKRKVLKAHRQKVWTTAGGNILWQAYCCLSHVMAQSDSVIVAFLLVFGTSPPLVDNGTMAEQPASVWRSEKRCKSSFRTLTLPNIQPLSPWNTRSN